MSHFKALLMSKEFSTPVDITQTVVDEEAFGGYAVETFDNSRIVLHLGHGQS